MSKTTDGQISLFENYTNRNYREEQFKDGQIEITKVSYIGPERTTWAELFSGYQELRVMTFSYSLPFISRLMKTFERGEVIIGFDRLIKEDAADLFALQEFVTNYVCKNAYLQRRIEDDEFRIYVVNNLVSHQKIYLLKSDSGRVRTILGSGNISERAWNGEQIEGFMCCDDLECYEHYLKAFELLKELSTDKISKDAEPIREDKSNAEELPVFQKIKAEHAVVINSESADEEKDYVFHATKLTKEWEEKIKAAKIKPSSDGKTFIDCAKINNLFGIIKKDNKIKKEMQQINPQLVVDFDEKSMSYNEKMFDLNPDMQDVEKDIINMMKYMDGFDCFTGDTNRLKTAYWKVCNYMFLSPFIAKMRYIGFLNGYDMRFFPMYMLIYGDSDAGKTKFIETIQKMMFGKIPRKVAKETFSNKPMASLKTEVKGCPVLIDEITPTYWKYAKEIVKFDEALIENRMINHPTFVLVSNDIKAVMPELSKRIVCINLDNRLNKTEAALNDRKIYSIRKELGTFFYREYVRRMFDKCEQLIEDIELHNKNEDMRWFPDIFKSSSEVILSIFSDLNITAPEELKEYQWFDYMGDSVIGEKATNIIKSEYEHNREIFSVNTKKNELEINFSCYDDREAKRKTSILHDELPANLECRVVGNKVILKLQETQEFTDIIFKQNLWFWKRR